VPSWRMVQRAAGFGDSVQFPLEAVLLEVAPEVE
jgi:hypothetical protein